MCTLVTLYGCHDRYPLIVLANRDERFARPSSVPGVLHDFHSITRHIVVAPKDGPSGGTWIGLTSQGFFAAITNQDTDVFDDKARSRGQVVSKVLRADDVFQATDYLYGLNPDAYNPFNLVYGSVFNMKIARVHRGRPVTIEQAELGTVVTSNDLSGGGKYDAKGKRAKELAEGIYERASLGSLLQKALHVLGDHENGTDNPHQAVCVHTEEFGTRSTSVLLIPRYREDHPRFFHSEGPTCASTGFAEYSYLFEG